MVIQPGALFGRYELVSRLGRGGMAETWRARLLGAAGVTKPVLIKRVLSEYSTDQAFTTMFISEARISATLSHGNIAQVYDFGRLDGEYFLAMEFVDGQPLHVIMKRALRSQLSSIPVPLAAFIGIELCRGLHYAHTRRDDTGKPLGIVHRDISPDNVLISYEGQVKIVDFGIAKARELRGFNTEPGVVKGKFLYFSPEQAHGQEVDARTDVWATGVVLYELLTGRLPVEGPQYAALPKLVRGEFPRPSVFNPELPKELEGIVMKALAVDPEQRFESSHAFGDALAGFLYSTSPRFSAMSLAHFLQELFREDLLSEGRGVQVPHSFLEQLALWRGGPPPTDPMAGRPVQTEPLPPPTPLVSTTETTRIKPQPRGTKQPLVSSRVTHLISAGAGAALMGMVLGVGIVVVKDPPREDPSRPRPLPPVPPPPEEPKPAPPLEMRTEAPSALPTPTRPRGSAVFPINSVLIEAQRDVFDVTRVEQRLPLEPTSSYRISEPNPPADAPPLFFWLAGQDLRAEGSVGVLSRQPRQIKAATGLKVFGLAPLPANNPRREVLVENLQSGDSGRLVLSPPEGAGADRAFSLTGLDEKATYRLEALPVADSAYTRGEQGGPIGMVACTAGPQQFVLKTDTSMSLTGASGLLCGFIDGDTSDNRGAVRLRFTAQDSSGLIEYPPPPDAPVKPRVDRSRARQYREDALTLFRAKQYTEASSLARSCLTHDPDDAQCYKLLAACHASLRELELAARYYRQFLILAPNDPSAPKVRQILENYEKSLGASYR
jgi:serine/threonine protein kinase